MHWSPNNAGVVVATLLAACAVPWAGPDLEAYVSAPLAPCNAEDAACGALVQPADSVLVNRLAGGDFEDATALARLTGMPWRPHEGRKGDLHVAFDTAGGGGETRTVYVVERIHSDVARDSVLSIASDGGAAVWLNGVHLGASRDVSRASRAHQDLYAVSLRPGGNVLVYKVLTRGAESKLHREWHGADALPDLLRASIDLNAYANLPRTSILPDTAAHVELRAAQIRLGHVPRIAFRWLTLLGESPSQPVVFSGTYPERLSLPAGFTGMAILEIEVSDPESDRLLYHEQMPIFADSTARGLARALTDGAALDDAASGDPVRAARIDAVRTVFGLADDSSATVFSAWHKAHALADLYRVTELPQSFHRFAGAQVWGYRDADGTVQPYWLTVPHSAARSVASADDALPGLVFSLTHHANPSYWLGRGRFEGMVIRLATMSTTSGNFGVVPHLGGEQAFAQVGIEEFPAITRQVAGAFRVDTAAVAILAWSSHARETVRVAQSPQVSLAWVGFAVPSLYSEHTPLAAALDSLHAVRPDLRWMMWRASEDDRIPRARTEAWVDTVRHAGFTVDYREVPYSTHLGGFFDDVEAELLRTVAAHGS